MPSISDLDLIALMDELGVPSAWDLDAEWQALLAADASVDAAAGGTARGDTSSGDTAGGDTTSGDTAGGDTAGGDTATPRPATLRRVCANSV